MATDWAQDMSLFTVSAVTDEIERLIGQVDQVVTEAGQAFVQKLDTTGSVSDHPYTRSPGSSAREDTGKMRRASGGGSGKKVEADARTAGQYAAEVGFTDGQEDYFLWQDQGWESTAGRMISGMNALATAEQVIQIGLEDLR